MADETLYLPQQPQPEPSVLQQLWDARPWKDYAMNPPSMAPQLGIALGLLHPRLGGATRDMGMARALAGQGDAPAAMQGLPSAARYAREPDMGMISNAYSPRPGNSNAPAVMHPQQGPVMSPARNDAGMAPVRQTQGANAQRWQAYEAHLGSLENAGVPRSSWPSYQRFMRDWVP
jgi:hypothetical protein